MRHNVTFLLSLVLSVSYLRHHRCYRFSEGFTVLVLTSRSLGHDGLGFAPCGRQGSDFVLLQVAIQLSQRHLFKRLFFLRYIAMASL